jgi:sigma-B regulation protein RsbU (phosphoserine phosphatase)
MAGTNPVPDSDQDADAHRVHEVHAGEVHDQAGTIFVGYDPQEAVSQETAGGRVYLTGYRDDGHTAVEPVFQEQPQCGLIRAHLAIPSDAARLTAASDGNMAIRRSQARLNYPASQDRTTVRYSAGAPGRLRPMRASHQAFCCRYAERVTAPPSPQLSAEAKLRDIQAITDAALSRLDARQFLAELLERLKGIMHADTAAVLLLDPSSRQLVATAASGLEAEVRQGVRIPVGRGFAGRIAAEQRPVIMNHVDHTNVLNPILLTRGIRSLIGVPLVASGSIIVVLHVGSLSARTFDDEDAELLQLAADRAARAMQAEISRADRVAAEVLQRSLVPSALPAVAGVDMAARYVPGDGDVGGDWYDVFTRPGGELCVVVGDVVGTGLKAAVIMGRMRSALRAYALETSDPAGVLRRLDRKMQHFEPDAMATVLYAVFDPAVERVRISSAGHPPPVTAAPGQPAALADITVDLLIGAGHADRHVTTLGVPPGNLLCFYTDGLVERRDRPLDQGLAMLCQAISAESPDAACVSAMAALVGDEPGSDDITLLIMRRQA